MSGGWSAPSAIDYDGKGDSPSVGRSVPKPVRRDDNCCDTCQTDDYPNRTASRSKTTDYGDGSYRPKLDFWEEVRGWGSILTGVILILIVAAGMVANDRSYAECLQKNPTNRIEMCQ